MPISPDIETGRPDRMLDPRVLDPDHDIVDYAGLDKEELEQVIRLLSAIRRWRESEQRLNLQSRNHMKLGETDMKALRYLVVAKNQGSLVTPSALAEHLHISSASTTKLLDRLAAAGHIVRASHPSDRRALTVTITQQTHERVRDTIGKKHARRFDVAAALPPASREIVIGFLNALADADDAFDEV